MVRNKHRKRLLLRKVKPDKTGALTIPGGLHIESHELDAARILTQYGYNVHFRPLDVRQGAKNPDVEIAGAVWEIKSPRGSSEKSTIESQFQRSKRQSRRLILSLLRCKVHDAKAIHKAEHIFFATPILAEMIIIDKKHRAIYFSTSK